jgi:hypothetical protein
MRRELLEPALILSVAVLGLVDDARELLDRVNVI